MSLESEFIGKDRKLKDYFVETLLPIDVESEKRKIDLESLFLAPISLVRPTEKRIIELVEYGHSGIAYNLITEYLKQNNDIELIELFITLELGLSNANIAYWSNIILEKIPTNLTALDKILGVNIEDKDWKMASENSNKILKIKPNDIRSLKFQISRNLKSKNWKRVIENSKNILLNNNDDEYALKSISEAYMSLNLTKKSIEYWGKYAKITDLNDDLRHKIGRIFYNANEYEKVIKIFENVDLEIRDLELLCRSHHSIKNWEECYQISSQLVIISPDNLLGLRLKMRSLRRMEDREGASIYAEKILKSDSKDAEAVRTLMQNAASTFDWKELEVITKIGLEIPKIRDESIRWHARSITRQGKNAKELWIKIIDENENEVEGRLELGKIYYRNNENESAKTYFNEILDIDPLNTKVAKMMASAMLRMGELSEAIPLLEAECIEEPQNVKAWERLIETNLKMERNEGVNIIWKRLLNNSWESLDCLLLAAEVALRFHWHNRYDWIINTRRNEFENNEHYFDKLGEIHFNVGDISTSWKYIRLSNSKNSDIIKNKIQDVLSLTGSSITHLEKFINEDKKLWIPAMALNKIIKNNRNVNPINDNNKILLISSSLNRGGAERQVAYTLRAMNKEKFNPTLVLNRIDNQNNGETYIDLLEKFSANIIQLSDIEINHSEVDLGLSSEDYKLLCLFPSTTIQMVSKMLINFKKESPDLIHSWQDEIILSSSIAGLLTGVPKILGSARSMRPDEKGDLHIRKRPHIGQCFNLLMKEDRFFLSANSFAGRNSYAEWLGVPSESISVVHNGVDFDYLKGNSDTKKFNTMIKKFGIKPKHKVIGGVFRLESGKRIDLWLECFKSALEEKPEIRGIIVGSGRMEKTIIKWIREKNLTRRVHLTGSVSDVYSWINRMDLFLFTSSSEGLPNVIIEAQGFGIPVVSTDAGGVNEIIIQGKSGEVVYSEDSVEICRAIITTLNSSNKMGEIAKNNSRNKFSIDSMIEQTERLYENILISK